MIGTVDEFSSPTSSTRRCLSSYAVEPPTNRPIFLWTGGARRDRCVSEDEAR